ncbi:MAG: SURF1 family protein, partial [Hyphomicrobiales bacterium]
MLTQEGQGARKRTSFGLIAFAAFTVVCALGFAALGIWQVERLAWKNQLVEMVETRSTAAPTDLDASNWSEIDAEASEYLRVSASGRFEGTDTLTQAVTVFGGGFWVMTPLHLADGRTLMVNRGFVTAAERDAGIPRPEGAVTVSGLLRASEPDGGFLRANDPSSGRWYSRDVT